MIDIRIGHCLELLRELQAESVQCCVTSPPYWGLRDYGLEGVVWDGAENCEHEWGESAVPLGNGDGQSFRRDRAAGVKRTGRQQGFCIHCDAWRGSLGLEPTPELYVEHLVEAFRVVRRVLRRDGTVWLNLGDSFSAGGNNCGSTPEDLTNRQRSNAGCRWERRPAPPGIKPKNLVMIPARVALALQADGWYLRSDIIWAKPNPMPESVTDRPTKSHEHVFLLARSEKYYYDAAAVAKPAVSDHGSGNGFKRPARLKFQDAAGARGSTEPWDGVGGTRNLRDVWTIPTEAYPEAHFATFPAPLVEPCIKAGTKPGDVVLDPFAGTGTVGEVARRYGRNAILIEQQTKYRELIDKRLAQGVLL